MQDFSLFILELKKKDNTAIKKGDKVDYPICEKRYLCPDCDSLLIKRPDKFKEGKFWFGCSNYPLCRFSCKDYAVDEQAKLIN